MHLQLLALSALVILSTVPALAQPDVECFAAFDSNGVRVARSFEADPVSDIFFADQGRLARFAIRMDTLEANGSLFFTEANCNGDPFMVREVLQPEAHRVGTDVWYPDTMAPSVARFANSRRHAESGQCVPEAGLVPSTVPALNFTLPTFTPPFHLEPEPCTSAESVAALTPYSLLAMTVVFAFGTWLIRRRPSVLAALAP